MVKEKAYGKPYGLVEGGEFLVYDFGPALRVAVSLLFGRIFTFTLSGLLLIVSVIIAALFMKEHRTNRKLEMNDTNSFDAI